LALAFLRDDLTADDSNAVMTAARDAYRSLGGTEAEWTPSA
jgi:hypothetical protein